MAGSPLPTVASSSSNALNQDDDRSAAFLLNHLPPINLELQPIRVPWMGGRYSVSSSKFLDMPAEWGFSTVDLARGDFGNHDDREGLIFLQHWLFFGLLEEALGTQQRIDPNDWIDGYDDYDRYDTTDVGQKYMVSHRLSSYLAAVQQRFRDPQRRPMWEDWAQVLGKTSEVADAFDMAFSQRCRIADVEQQDSLKITWSIYMLGQILSTTTMIFYRTVDWRFVQWPTGALLHFRLSQRLECPHRCSKIAKLFAVDGLYIMSQLAFCPPARRNTMLPDYDCPDDDHETFLAPLSLDDEDAFKGRGRHWQCTTQRCLGEMVDERSYRTAHSPVHCKCDSIGPNVKEVIEILDDSEVPAFVVLEEITEGQPTVSVEVIRASSSAYVAISHVWADGLGNKDDNTLPKCQASRLASLVEALTGRKGQPFWIDTFGIPRDLEERKKALRVMDSTYKLAEKVLVLDGSLQQHTRSQTTENESRGLDVAQTEAKRLGVALELCLRIVCCSWTSRLWTLPEGMLGPELHFQFSDGAVELGDLVAQLRFVPYTNIARDLITSLARLRPKLLTQRRMGLGPMDPMMQTHPRGDAYGRFIAMFHALEFRDTSWKEDEATCLGIHLELDLPAILARPESQRLEALFAQLECVPADLIFTHGERIPRYPYRWAPLHLLEYKDNYLVIPGADPARPVGVRTDRGLLVEVDCFILHTKDEILPATTEIYFSIQIISDSGIKSSVSYGMRPAAKDSEEAVNWRQCNTNQAFMTREEAPERLYVVLGDSGIPGPFGPFDSGRVGLLVQKDSEENGVIYGKPLDAVVVFQMRVSKPVRRKNSDSFVHWNAEKMVSGQVCIG